MVRKKIKKNRRNQRRKDCQEKHRSIVHYERFREIVTKLVNNDYPSMRQSTRSSVATRTAQLLYNRHDISDYTFIVNVAITELCKEAITDVLEHPDKADKMRDLFYELTEASKRDFARTKHGGEEEDEVSDIARMMSGCKLDLYNKGTGFPSDLLLQKKIDSI